MTTATFRNLLVIAGLVLMAVALFPTARAAP